MGMRKKDAIAKINRSVTVRDAAAAAGISVALLRWWQKEHGWPNPPRDQFNRRAFRPQDIAMLIDVAAAVRKGASIAKIIVNGEPVLPSKSREQDLAIQVARMRECLCLDPMVYFSEKGRLLREAALRRVVSV